MALLLVMMPVVKPVCGLTAVTPAYGTTNLIVRGAMVVVKPLLLLACLLALAP